MGGARVGGGVQQVRRGVDEGGRRGGCSLASSGVGFKSLHYASQPQGRGKSRRVYSCVIAHSSLISRTPGRYYEAPNIIVQ